MIETDDTVSPQTAGRSDGRQINVEYNMWFQTTDDITYLNLVDYFESSASDYSYDVTLLQTNEHKPTFESTDYYANISESATVDHYVITLQATDADDDQVIKFQLKDNGEAFSIDESSGEITLGNLLDRETADTYVVTVLAIDNGTPPQTATAAVQVNVMDVNDNSPAIRVPTDVIRIEEIIAEGETLFTVTASDPDLGPNGDVTLILISDYEFFEFDPSTDILKVKHSLQEASGSYDIEFLATDNGATPRQSSASVTIKVVPVNLHNPVFEQVTYSFDTAEGSANSDPLGQTIATEFRWWHAQVPHRAFWPTCDRIFCWFNNRRDQRRCHPRPWSANGVHISRRCSGWWRWTNRPKVGDLHSHCYSDWCKW